MAALLALLAHSLVVIVVACIVLCAGMFLAQPIAPMFVALTAGEAKGSATALYQSFYYLGAVFGSTLPGLAWDRWAWPGVVGTCVASLVVALLADWLLCGTRHPERLYRTKLAPRRQLWPLKTRGALVRHGAARQRISRGTTRDEGPSTSSG
jgi:sugar phosphate permease